MLVWVLTVWVARVRAPARHRARHESSGKLSALGGYGLPPPDKHCPAPSPAPESSQPPQSCGASVLSVPRCPVCFGPVATVLLRLHDAIVRMMGPFDVVPLLRTWTPKPAVP